MIVQSYIKISHFADNLKVQHLSKLFQFKQFFGECNKLDWAMRDCTKKERLQKVAENRESSKTKNAAVQKRMGELKADDWRSNLKEKLDSSS